jgi:hypothetical protein
MCCKSLNLMPNPWDSEPDSLDFESDGLPCVMRRNHVGVWCGYVGIGQDHPWFGLPHNTMIKPHPDMLKNRDLMQDTGAIDLFLAALRGGNPEEGIEIGMALAVHGGITWSGELPGNEHHRGFFWYGFDCGHAGDIVPAMVGRDFGAAMKPFMTEQQQKDFDKHIKPIMARSFAGSVYRDQQYVVSECQSLAAQLARVKEPQWTATPLSERGKSTS